MWSVLPTTTGVQLDAIVRGEDALRAPSHPERETSIIRGRSLDVLRRMRLGHRDAVKLDLLEGRLRDAGVPERERLDALAAEVTPILARYIESSPTRALVVVAGDHGFSFRDLEDAFEGRRRDFVGVTKRSRNGRRRNARGCGDRLDVVQTACRPARETVVVGAHWLGSRKQRMSCGGIAF